MLLYVIRHGESEANQKKRWSGCMDVQLTEKGKTDAMHAKKILEGVAFDKIYTSDLIRAMQTAEIAIPGCVYEKSPLIREIDVGSIAGNLFEDDTPEEKLHYRTIGYGIKGGEDLDAFQRRINEFMGKMEKLDCNKVAVFSHRGCLLGMLNFVLDQAISKSHILCNNCTVAVFAYENNVWKLHSWMNPM